jgi:hypothetical protein
MRFLTLLMLLLSMYLVQAQTQVEARSSGKTTPIVYGETEVSDAQVGDNLIVKMTTSLLTTTHPLPNIRNLNNLSHREELMHCDETGYPGFSDRL